VLKRVLVKNLQRKESTNDRESRNLQQNPEPIRPINLPSMVVIVDLLSLGRQLVTLVE
jgi:hypothetical protein